MATTIDVVSGFLGAGKTTLIKKLLKDGLQNEKVVLIENEFGEIGIDTGFLKDSGIQITEMNSGCICCTLVGDFADSLAEVLTKYAPDRILIEPSGVGKLSDVTAAVRSIADEMEGVVVGGSVTVADVGKCKMYMKNFGEFYNNQVESAGTIVLSRTQNVSEDKIQETVAMLREHNPNAVIITTPWDELSGEQILDTMKEGVSLEEELFAEMHHDEEEEECECGHHHHHHYDENGVCECGHHHDDEDEDEDEHEHHHHHHDDEDEDEDEHEHHHHHHEDEHEDEHEHHHHHHDDEDEDEDEHEHHHHHHDDDDEDEDEHEHHHHHHDDDDEDEDEHEHHHHYDENGVCSCGHHHHHHHHHHGHDADEVFTSWGFETARKYTEEEIQAALSALDSGDYGVILRAKGYVASAEGWIHFDFVPGEPEVRHGSAQITGKICVIGSKLNEEKLAQLFRK